MDYQTPHTESLVTRENGIATFHAVHTTAPGGVIVCRDMHGTVYSQFETDHDRIGCPAEWQADAAAIDAAPLTVPSRMLLGLFSRRLVGLPR